MTRPVPPPATPAAEEEAMRLRERAEARYAQTAPPDDGLDATTLPPALHIKLQLHELRVHQIELEMQNESLRQTQVALEVARQRYFELYDLAPVGYLTIGTDGVILESNLNAAMQLGTPRKQLIGEAASRFVAFDSQDTFYRFKQQCFNTGEPRTCQIQLKRQDGLPFWARLSANLQSDDIGPVMHIAFTDINHSQELEEAQARLASIVEESNDAIYSRSLAGNILSWNKAAERMLGYTAAEALGQPHDFGLSEGHRPTWSERVEQVQRGERVSVELTRLTKHGKPLPVRTTYAPIRDHAGLIVGVSVILQDLSALKEAQRGAAELEAQLRESQKMEAIGTLAGGIAHDFNNIVATILGNADLAAQDVGDPRKLVESLDEIRKAGLRARDLVHQILAFSRREPTRRVPLRLAGVVEESVRLLRSTLPTRVRLEVALAEYVPTVLADATQIEQVLINLATNAMQAMHGGAGTIRMGLDMPRDAGQLAPGHAELHALWKQHPGRLARLTVSDDGEGMDAATLERIFEPFFTTKPMGEGTGLGLAVVHGIVRAHDGVITAASTPGQGTSFALYLPATALQTDVPAGPPSADNGNPALHPGRKPRVLYVDDDEALLFLVKRLLERRGLEVVAFGNQQEALQALHATPEIDLVLTDYNMPGMSGLEVARRVRSIRADLPVVITSGFIDENLRAQAAGVGVRELIFKASNAEEFCEAICQHARNATMTPGSS